MQDKERQVKNSVIYFGQLGLSMLIPILTLPLFTRALAKDDYGILAMAEVYGFIVNGLAWAGLEAAYERNFFKYRQDTKKLSQLTYSTLAFSLSAFCVLALATYFLKNVLAGFILHNQGYGYILFGSFSAIFMVRVNEFYLAYFKNSEDAGRYLIYQSLFIILNMVLAIYLVVFTKCGVIGMIGAQFLAALGVCILLTKRMLVKFKPAVNWAILKESLKIGLPLTPISFVKIIGTRIDNIMINFLVSLGVLGIYNIGQKISNIIFSFMNTMEYVFRPQIYKRMFDLKEKGAESIGRYLTPFIFLSLGFALFMVLFCEEAVFILTPPSFHGAVDVAIVLSMYCSLLFFGKVTTPQLIYAKKPHILTFLLIPTYLLNIVFNIPFIMRWGAIGAAWATLLARLIAGLIAIKVAQKYYYIKWEYKKILAMFILIAGAGVGLIFMRHLGVVYWPKLLIKCLFLGAYALLGIKCAVLTKDNLRLLASAVRLKPGRPAPAPAASV